MKKRPLTKDEIQRQTEKCWDMREYRMDSYWDSIENCWFLGNDIYDEDEYVMSHNELLCMFW